MKLNYENLSRLGSLHRSGRLPDWRQRPRHPGQDDPALVHGARLQRAAGETCDERSDSVKIETPGENLEHRAVRRDEGDRGAEPGDPAHHLRGAALPRPEGLHHQHQSGEL